MSVVSQVSTLSVDDALKIILEACVYSSNHINSLIELLPTLCTIACCAIIKQLLSYLVFNKVFQHRTYCCFYFPNKIITFVIHKNVNNEQVFRQQMDSNLTKAQSQYRLVCKAFPLKMSTEPVEHRHIRK